MKTERFNNVNQLNKMLIDNYVLNGFKCIDATVGNGLDTLAIAGKVGGNGIVYGFDIQKEALDITKSKLIEAGLIDKVMLINDSHENIDNYVEEKANFIIYNLGYLPGGNKEIKTRWSSTLKSLTKALTLIESGGIILITFYRGHAEGLEEYELAKVFLENLDQKDYNVFEVSLINQKNYPPITIGVESRGGEQWQK